MESLYQIVGISRQGFHKHRRKTINQTKFEHQVIDQVRFHRIDHPRMGPRPMYWMMQSSENELDTMLLKELGRDRFEEILIRNGLRVDPIRVFHKTTYSGSFRFPNLVEGITIQRINHIWISDLTYYRLTDRWAYLTFILDLYSRRCIGYSLSENRTTEKTTIPALKMALQTRAHNIDQPLIFHSDGGGQYYDKEFIKIIKKNNIESSMAELVYENPHMERFHSTAKNDYLIPWGVNSFDKLKKNIGRFVYLYNEVRPHESLKYKTPVGFEHLVQQIPLCQRPSVLFKKIT